MSALAQAAADYAARGMAVFPLIPRGKLPLIPADAAKARARGFDAPGRGCRDASTDPAKVAAWWKRESRANIGLATGPASGLLVVDLDGAEAAEAYKARFDIGGPLIQRTVRGWHLCYAWTDDCADLSISAGRLGAGIDTRGDGGYIVVAPSVRDDGAYCWHNDGEPGPPPPALIAELRKPVERKRKVKAALFDRVDGQSSRWGEAVLAGLCRKVRDAPAGQQELLLNWASYRAGQAVGGGEVASGYALDHLLAAARLMPSHDPRWAWGFDELREKIARGITDGRAMPRRAEEYRA